MTSTPGSAYLLDAALDEWPHILSLYRQFKKKGPVMLFDLQEQRIYAYPLVDFKKELSERSQKSLQQQFDKANENGQIVVFVRDNEQRRLVSYSMNDE